MTENIINTYMVLYTDKHNETLIVWFYDSFEKADEYAKSLYEKSIKTYNFNTDNNIIKPWKYEIILKDIENNKLYLDSTYHVVEINNKQNEPCEIEIISI